jgi:hypothetical protein
MLERAIGLLRRGAAATLLVGLSLLLGLLLVPVAATAQSDQTGDVHLGVATCAGGPCHGSANNVKKTGVLQNEYLTWQKYDKHAKAYTALEGPIGQRIGRNLGITPTTSPMCLNCHADNVDASLRGVQFHIEDGVGCEACHGGAKNWLGPHVTGQISHAQLVSDYHLVALDQPVARAVACMKCHWGDNGANQFVTHKIMGAGHPRLAFELETFTQIEPAHFVIDDVYRKRKPVAQAAQIWAVGQAVALSSMMDTMRTRLRSTGTGVFPELVFFDCDSCHHPTTTLRWAKRASSGLGPGVPHFNDANALMLEAVAEKLAPEQGQALDRQVLQLHAALSGGQEERAIALAGDLKATADSLTTTFAQHQFTRDDLRVMVAALVARAQDGDAVDYAGAEQMTMAVASIVYTLKADGDVDAEQFAALKAALDQLYAATKDENAYVPEPFVTAMQGVGQALPSS